MVSKLRLLLTPKILVLLFGTVIFTSAMAEAKWNWHWQMTNDISATVSVSTKGTDGYWPLNYEFSDGSSKSDSLQLRTESGEKRLYKIENKHGEYFIVQKDGSLNVYDKEGYIRNLRRMN
jgi:hypothetical protein